MKILNRWVINFQLLLATNLLLLHSIAEVEVTLKTNLNTGVNGLAFDWNEYAALRNSKLEFSGFPTVILKYLSQ